MEPVVLKSVLIMATHMMEKDALVQNPGLKSLMQKNIAKVSGFVSHLVAGLFNDLLDFGDRSAFQAGFSQGMLDYLSYDWPIINVKSHAPIELSVEQTLISVMQGLVSTHPSCIRFIGTLRLASSLLLHENYKAKGQAKTDLEEEDKPK